MNSFSLEDLFCYIKQVRYEWHLLKTPGTGKTFPCRVEFIRPGIFGQLPMVE